MLISIMLLWAEYFCLSSGDSTFKSWLGKNAFESVQNAFLTVDQTKTQT